MKRLLTTLMCLAIVRNAPAVEWDWLMPHASYDFDISSAYISRGKVYEDRPIQSNEVDIHFNLGEFGRIGFDHWDYSCLSDKYQGQYRRFMPETDWSLYYEYDWQFSEAVALATQLMIEWQTYYGGKPDDDPTSIDYRIKQTLKNPYVMPYYKIHYTRRPVEWWYYQIGLKRKFKIFGKFSLTPNVAIDLADNQGRIKRFGRRTALGSYGPGVVSVIGEIIAEYEFTDWFSVHAKVGQFGLIDTAGRDNRSDAHQRDLTYGQVGFRLSF